MHFLLCAVRYRNREISFSYMTAKGFLLILLSSGDNLLTARSKSVIRTHISWYRETDTHIFVHIHQTHKAFSHKCIHCMYMYKIYIHPTLGCQDSNHSKYNVFKLFWMDREILFSMGWAEGIVCDLIKCLVLSTTMLQNAK